MSLRAGRSNPGKTRLDQELVRRGLVATRSQAENYIRLGRVRVGGRVITKPGFFVTNDARIELDQDEQFVSRAALKLKSVADKLQLDFADKIVLDVGSSTGGFTEFALSRGAKKVIAVDVGTDQLHPKLRGDSRIELHEKTDIRKFRLEHKPDIILIDVSFISLREILPHVAQYLATPKTAVVAMVKPQFETGARVKNAGVVKNDTERRRILRDFEAWVKKYFLILAKADSEIPGTHGNQERFYVLKCAKMEKKENA
ncbi:TlyA family RNA methyltransferase [Candidatus Saccharibacteria bacterium]|nr:TlyA family RNA methyltransferase [Candidatus Saccharibacteria bacterium]